MQSSSSGGGGEGRSLVSSIRDLSDNEFVPPKEKNRRRRNSAQSKENLVDFLKEYRLEQKLKEEELERNLEEIHLKKMSRFDRL